MSFKNIKPKPTSQRHNTRLNTLNGIVVTISKTKLKSSPSMQNILNWLSQSHETLELREQDRKKRIDSRSRMLASSK